MNRLFVKAATVSETHGVQGVYLPREKLEELQAYGYTAMNAYALYKAEQPRDQLTGAPLPNSVRFSIDVRDTWVLFGERPEDVG